MYRYPQMPMPRVVGAEDFHWASTFEMLKIIQNVTWLVSSSSRIRTNNLTGEIRDDKLYFARSQHMQTRTFREFQQLWSNQRTSDVWLSRTFETFIFKFTESIMSGYYELLACCDWFETSLNFGIGAKIHRRALTTSDVCQHRKVICYSARTSVTLSATQYSLRNEFFAERTPLQHEMNYCYWRSDVTSFLTVARDAKSA